MSDVRRKSSSVELVLFWLLRSAAAALVTEVEASAMSTRQERYGMQMYGRRENGGQPWIFDQMIWLRELGKGTTFTPMEKRRATGEDEWLLFERAMCLSRQCPISRPTQPASQRITRFPSREALTRCAAQNWKPFTNITFIYSN